MTIPEADVEAVKAAARIEQIIGATVHLRADGSGRQAGLCPFHDERTPSFKVDLVQQRFHCFGCGEHGDVVDFVQQSEHLGFVEAVTYLAERTGVRIRNSTDPAEEQRQQRRRRLVSALAEAAAFYRAQLHTDAAGVARAQLTSRGFTKADAESHGCGYAPAAGDRTPLRQHLEGRGFTTDELKAAGLLNQRGRDFFHDRLLWPIADPTGHVVGFSGRRLSQDGPGGKYINSPAGEVFDKSSLLYRLHTAKKAARQHGAVHVVEGYTDVMAMERAGLVAVASCGTAFTEEHLQTLLRALGSDVDVVFCFDGDTGGQKAISAAWSTARAVLPRCSAVVLAAGDPCDLWQSAGDEGLTAALSAPIPLTEAHLQGQLQPILGPAPTPDRRARAVAVAGRILGELQDPTLREGYRQHAATVIGVPEHHITVTPPASPPPAPGRGDRRASREQPAREQPPPEQQRRRSAPTPDGARADRRTDTAQQASRRQVSLEKGWWATAARSPEPPPLPPRTWFVTGPGQTLWDACDQLEPAGEGHWVEALAAASPTAAGLLRSLAGDAVDAAEVDTLRRHLQQADIRRQIDSVNADLARDELTAAAAAEQLDALYQQLHTV